MHLFEAVKQSVITRQAAERYGLNVNRNGMAVCPFHRDRHPSMKVDRRYYCFGCGATGDVIDFVSRLHGISAKEAALMLAQDFSIPCGDGTDAPRQSAVKKLRQEAEEQKYRRMERHCFQVLADYYHLLRRWREEHAPSQMRRGILCLWKPCKGWTISNTCWTGFCPMICGNGLPSSQSTERK